MFKHILLPTDGSPLSEVAIKKGMQFAKSVGAQVTGIYVIDPFHLFSTGSEMLSDTKEQYVQDSRAHARSSLSMIYTAAKESGVTCDCITETSAQPYEVIVETAQKKGCDLIMMASHGRRGMQALLLGSETTKVLTHTKIPVLVLR